MYAAPQQENQETFFTLFLLPPEDGVAPTRIVITRVRFGVDQACVMLREASAQDMQLYLPRSIIRSEDPDPDPAPTRHVM